jgi:peptidoglycan/xylan/chitin deacetylase (PgdA/CDA1 family)
MCNSEKSWRRISMAAFICAFTAFGVRAEGVRAESWGEAAQSGTAPQCWTPAELKSSAEERLIRRDPSAPDLSRLEEFRPGDAPAEGLRGSIRRVKLPAGKKLVALTFDLCEAPGEVAGYDGGVVDYLRANQVPATFFAGGKWLISHPQRGAQLLGDPLFEVGNHSWSHRNLRLAKGDELRGEVIQAGAAYQTVASSLSGNSCVRDSAALSRRAATPVRLFRFPYGTCSPEALDVVANAGMLAIQWDVVTGDPFKGLTAEGIAKEVLRATKPGSIIVAHANGRGWNTAAALPLFIPALRAKGYEFVTVSNLLAAGQPEIASDCYELRPGDNARYDALGKSGAAKKTAPDKPAPESAGGGSR